jgi:hypothetical protein
MAKAIAPKRPQATPPGMAKRPAGKSPPPGIAKKNINAIPDGLVSDGSFKTSGPRTPVPWKRTPAYKSQRAKK